MKNSRLPIGRSWGVINDRNVARYENTNVPSSNFRLGTT